MIAVLKSWPVESQRSVPGRGYSIPQSVYGVRGVMAATVNSKPYLLQQFQAFYAEIMHLKQQVQSGTWIFLLDASPEGDGDAAAAEHAVWQQAFVLLEQQAPVDGKPMEVAGAALSRDVQFVMAVVADEVFLRLRWSGKERWNAQRLEQRLFGTASGGTLFFDKLDHLLQVRDPVYTDVASIYLTALALGYRGKFWESDEGGQIDLYRRQLFQLIYHRKPDLLDASQRLFPKAYDYTVTAGQMVLLPQARQWVAALVVAGGIWLGVSYGAWHYVTDESFAVVQELIEAGEAR